MDLLAILIVFLFYYVNGYTFGNPDLSNVPSKTILNLIAWSLGVLGFITLANMTDYESDKEAKVKNSVVRFGLRANAVFVFLTWLLASILVNMEYKPLMYYIYLLTALYLSLIFVPTQTYSKALFIITTLSYIPIATLYIKSLTYY